MTKGQHFKYIKGSYKSIRKKENIPKEKWVRYKWQFQKNK